MTYQTVAGPRQLTMWWESPLSCPGTGTREPARRLTSYRRPSRPLSASAPFIRCSVPSPARECGLRLVDFLLSAVTLLRIAILQGFLCNNRRRLENLDGSRLTSVKGML